MDTKRTLLAFVFAVSLLMLWQNWVAYTTPPPTAQPVAGAPGSAPAASSDLPATAQQLGQAQPQTLTPATTASGDYESLPKAVVRTDSIVAEVSALGGDIIRLEFVRHNASGDLSKNFVLFENKGRHTYLAQSGLSSEGLPNHKTVFELPAGEHVMQDGQNTLQLRLKAPALPSGVEVTKVLTFKRDSYVVDVSYEINNASAQAINTGAYFHLVRDDQSAENTAGFLGGVTTFTGPAFYTEEGKFQKVDFSDIGTRDAKFVEQADNGWVAMVQHYFVSAFLPAPGVARKFYADRNDSGLYRAGVSIPVAIAAGQQGSVTVPLYAGPQEQNKIKELAPGLDLVVDYGWVTLIAVPLFWLLSTVHGLVGNWGWAIIIVTILIKLAFFPLSAASYKSMAKMKTLMPRMKQLQERYASDKMRMNQELMELYKKEKVNPMGGCLPILVQIPVFIALYWVLLGAVEMRQAPWILWITDLSAMDPYYVLPLVMGLTMFIQTKLNPTPPDPIQAKVMLAMPIIFTVMFLWFPSGLVLYWVVNNTLSIAQQWYITRNIESGAKTAK